LLFCIEELGKNDANDALFFIHTQVGNGETEKKEVGKIGQI